MSIKYEPNPTQRDIFEPWIKRFILRKKALTILEKIYVLLVCIAVFLGAINIFSQFLSPKGSIIFLLMLLVISITVDIKLKIVPLFKNKIKKKKLIELKENRTIEIVAWYTTLIFISWFVFSYFSNWAIFITSLYHLAIWGGITDKEHRLLNERFVYPYYDKDLLNSVLEDDVTKAQKPNKENQQKK
jgi:hypothetical protein